MQYIEGGEIVHIRRTFATKKKREKKREKKNEKKKSN